MAALTSRKQMKEKKSGKTMMMTKKNILISGASIAGPTLAYWLKRYGFNPTVVERAPAVREGGYPIDIRDEAVDLPTRCATRCDQ